MTAPFSTSDIQEAQDRSDAAAAEVVALASANTSPMLSDTSVGMLPLGMTR